MGGSEKALAGRSIEGPNIGLERWGGRGRRDQSVTETVGSELEVLWWQIERRLLRAPEVVLVVVIAVTEGKALVSQLGVLGTTLLRPGGVQDAAALDAAHAVAEDVVQREPPPELEAVDVPCAAYRPRGLAPAFRAGRGRPRVAHGDGDAVNNAGAGIPPLLQVDGGDGVARDARVEEIMSDVEDSELHLLGNVAVLADERSHCSFANLRQLLLSETNCGVIRFVPETIASLEELELKTNNAAEGGSDYTPLQWCFAKTSCE